MLGLLGAGELDAILEWAKSNPLVLVIGAAVFLFWDKIAALLPQKPPADPVTPPVVVTPVTPITDKIENLISLVTKIWPLIQPMLPKSSDPKSQAEIEQHAARIDLAIDELKKS